MADKKISDLTPATTPLAGTEVLPIVQGGSTVKVSVDNMTAGKAVSALNVAVTGATVPANGVYLPAANTVAISTNSAGKVWVDTNGNMGVGNNAPTYKVDASADSAAIARVVSGTGYSGYVLSTNDATASARNWLMAGTFSDYGDLCFVQSNARSGNPISAGTVRFSINQAGNPVVNTGNLVIGTAGKGIDFSANAHAAGMTSELLNDYEEGTFTPALAVASGSLTYSVQGTPLYTKIGRLVNAVGYINVSVVNVPSGALTITGLPYSSFGFVPVTLTLFTGGFSQAYSGYITSGSTTISITNLDASIMVGGENIMFAATYPTT